MICSFYLSVAARKIVCADPSPEIHSHVAGTISNQQTKQTPSHSGTGLPEQVYPLRSKLQIKRAISPALEYHILTHSRPITKYLVTANLIRYLCISLVCSFYVRQYLLAGLVDKASAPGAEDLGFESRLRRDLSGSSHNSDLKLAFQWLPCQAPGDIGSALGLVGPVSVYCDWVR